MIVKTIEQRFPDDISYGAKGGPEYKTDVLTSISGYEKRNINWLNARGRYNVSHSVKDKKQMEELLAFFHNCYGKAISFRFKDWNDYKASLQQIDIADGFKTAFQLIKIYEVGAHTVVRKITKPVKGSVEVFFYEKKKLRSNRDNANYILQQVTVDYDSGLITFDLPPKEGQIIYASFEFDILARFDTDILNASLDDHGVYSWKDIPIIEIKE